jgi:hypothetical protein
MSTRALYTFKANPNCAWEQDWNVYKHHDGYPTGAAEALALALSKAWPLPRYESDEFATAFIAANKDNPGGIRMMPQGDPDEVSSKHCSDIEYRYEISMRNEKLYVSAFTSNGDMSKPLIKNCPFMEFPAWAKKARALAD